MGKQGQPRPPRDNGPDTDTCADGLWLARPGSAKHTRLTQSVADPVPVANLTDEDPAPPRKGGWQPPLSKFTGACFVRIIRGPCLM